MPPSNRPSAAAARRLAQQSTLTSSTANVVDTDVAAALAGYRPRALDEDTWLALAPVVGQALTVSKVRGTESLRKHITHVALFYAWAAAEDLPLTLETLSRARVEAYTSRGMASSSAKSRADRRSHLRRVAGRLHPEEVGPSTVVEKPLVRPPYSQPELAALVRAALAQPSPALRRAMCFCVGLGAGAGLASSDFRGLRRRHLHESAAGGLDVEVPAGAGGRRIPVMDAYAALVQVGLDGLAPDDLLLNVHADSRNLAARAVEQAILPSDCPRIEQSRLRHSWLTHMMSQAVPLQVLLAAAGLKTARTLTDLTALLPPPDPEGAEVLRMTSRGRGQ